MSETVTYTCGSIFWVIAAFALAAVIIFLDRLMAIRRTLVDRDDVFNGIENLLSSGRAEEAISVCEENSNAITRVVAAAIGYRELPADERHKLVDVVIRTEHDKLLRRIAMLGLVARITPLLGLLATVVGLMKTLIAMNAQAALITRGDLYLGTMQALVAVAAGLAIAIPVHAMDAFLRSRIGRVHAELEAAGAEILAILVKPQEKCESV